MRRTWTKSQGNAAGPYKRNTAAVTHSVSDQSRSRTPKISSPKLSTSFFAQFLPDALNKRLILSTWNRSLSRLSFSNSPLFFCFSVCESFAFFQASGALVARRSAGCGFTAASLASSSFATVKLVSSSRHAEMKQTNAYVLREHRQRYYPHPIHLRQGRELGSPGGLPAADLQGMSPHPGSVFPLLPSYCGVAIARLTN